MPKNNFSYPQIESILQATIFPDLEQGRKGFDLEHTQAVVHWTKKLLAHVELTTIDPLVSVTAAYAHDWGYYKLFEGIDNRSIEMVHKMKPLHMERGAKMINNLIATQLSDFFTNQQQERVTHLVRVHDIVEKLQDDDEILIMEADTLGMLDTDLMKPTYSKEDNAIFMEDQVKKRRFPHFKHTYAKKVGKIVYQKRLDFYDSK